MPCSFHICSQASMFVYARVYIHACVVHTPHVVPSMSHTCLHVSCVSLNYACACMHAIYTQAIQGSHATYTQTMHTSHRKNAKPLQIAYTVICMHAHACALHMYFAQNAYKICVRCIRIWFLAGGKFQKRQVAIMTQHVDRPRNCLVKFLNHTPKHQLFTINTPAKTKMPKITNRRCAAD